jgi:hypothetical protein
VLPFNNIAQAFLLEKFLCPGPTAADGGKLAYLTGGAQ